MKVWAFDENRADFVDAAPERMNADATGYYIIRRGDDVLVREHGQERPMPERLTALLQIVGGDKLIIPFC